MSTDFSRLRPRAPQSRDAGRAFAPPRDTEGARVLFSATSTGRRTGGVSVDCSSCGRTTPVSFLGVLRLAVPSLHLPLLRRGHWSWMLCPACERRTWVRLRVFF